MRRRPALLSVVAAASLLGAATAVNANAATNDAFTDRQWGLKQVKAEAAWPTSTGAGTVVAVVDSGVDLSHPDLQGKLVPGITTIDCGKASTCGNGDWKGQDGEGQSPDTHGTHVAGIIGAAADNGIGIAGVARDAKIMPIKSLEDGSGSFEDIATGIRYAADNGAGVINLSLGALPGSQALVVTGLFDDVQQAITYARSKNVVVVAAAGNEAFPLCDTPAFDRGALCVTATDKREAPAAYSNFGLKPDLMSVAAPGGSLLPICGEDVVSTVPDDTGRSEVCGYGKAYDEYAGTSMAAPHAAGVAALLRAQGRSATETVDVLLRTSRQPVTNARGVFTPNYGYGIVDAQAAVAAPLSTTTTEPTTEPTSPGKGKKDRTKPSSRKIRA